MATSTKKEIKNATKATKTTVGTDYTAGSYAAENARVDTTAANHVNNATTQAETAYKLASANNESRAQQSHATNKVVTKQIGTAMRNGGYSQTSRNIASSASARSAGTINTAKTKANENAELTRATTVNKAKVSAYETAAKNKASNTKADIERSTQQSKTKAQQAYESAEAKKNRQLTNALNQREDDLTARKRKYEKKQRKLDSYANTLSTRYRSVKAIDKAIAKMKKNKDTHYRKTKLSYLRALRAQLKLEEKNKKKSGSKKSGSSRRSYGYRRYGSSKKSTTTTSTPPKQVKAENPNKAKKKAQDEVRAIRLQNKAKQIKAKNKKRKTSQTAKKH